MSPTPADLTSCSRSSRPTSWWPYPICSDLSLKSCTCGRQGVLGNLFVQVNRLCMLSEIVESRESTGAVTLERTFASMFSTIISIYLESFHSLLALT